MVSFFFFQAEDGIRDLVRSRGLGDVYKRQLPDQATWAKARERASALFGLAPGEVRKGATLSALSTACLLYTSDAADERSSVDLGGRRIIKKKNNTKKKTQPVVYVHKQSNEANNTINMINIVE
mgnify:CR=1 FL=1